MSKKRKHRLLTEYQLETRKTLVEIGGVPAESHCMKSFGIQARIWVWRIGKRSKRTNNILIMADKAQDMGLQTYRIYDYLDYRQINHIQRKFEVVRELDKINRVVVWCPEEPV